MQQINNVFTKSSLLKRAFISTSKRSFSSASTRTPIVGGNWKLNAGNGTTYSTVEELVNGLNKAPAPTSNVEIICAAPTLYLDRVNQTLDSSKFSVSAQNCFYENKGAYTGENSAVMLKDLNINWTLIGHSERRDIFHETDDMLQRKITNALNEQLSVIACCGEHKEDRENGTTMNVLVPQLQAMADGVENSTSKSWDNVVIAYEPVWAIGTGLTATPEQAQETHANIRAWLRENVSESVANSVRIQYGGSVTDANAKELGNMPDIDGFLVGGASLDAGKFSVIYSAFD